MFNKVTAVVLFAEDFEMCLAFYRDKLELPVALLEPDFAAFKMNDQDFAIQRASAAAEMFGAAAQTRGNDRAMLCTRVADIDATYEKYKANGVEFLKEPVDQYWGIRCAYFRDPEGNLWEIASPIETAQEG